MKKKGESIVISERRIDSLKEENEEERKQKNKISRSTGKFQITKWRKSKNECQKRLTILENKLKFGQMIPRDIKST